jgi:hypothetical protein
VVGVDEMYAGVFESEVTLNLLADRDVIALHYRGQGGKQPLLCHHLR